MQVLTTRFRHSAAITRAARASAVFALTLGVLSCGGGDGITVTNNVASLRFVTQPANVTVGATFTAQVELLNSNGARITSATNVVTISATGATLSGGLSVAAVAGVATFPGLSVTTVGTSVQLQAAAAGRSVTSSTFAAADPCAPLALSVPGSANGSVSAASCLTGGLRAAVFQFSAPATGASSFTVTADFAARIEVTSDPPASNISVTNSQGSTVAGEWLLPSGNYRFRVGATSGTGSFTLSATNPPGNQGCLVRLLVVSGTFQQGLAAGDCPYEDVANWFFDAFAIFATQPCTITLRSAAFDAYLELRNTAFDQILAEDDDSGGGVNGTDARLTLASCSNGANPVIIVANSLAPGESGAYTIEVQLTGVGADNAGEPLTVQVPHGVVAPAAGAISASPLRMVRGKR